MIPIKGALKTVRHKNLSIRWAFLLVRLRCDQQRNDILLILPAVTFDQQAAPSDLQYTFFCDHLVHSRIKHWPRLIRPSVLHGSTSRSQTFPFDFKCYCGWAQIVQVICAGYLLFSARSTECLYTVSQKNAATLKRLLNISAKYHQNRSLTPYGCDAVQYPITLLNSSTVTFQYIKYDCVMK